MKEYVCTHCGYHMTDENMEENISALAAYPFMTSGGGIIPFAAMKYIATQSEKCPICNSVDCWEEIH